MTLGLAFVLIAAAGFAVYKAWKKIVNSAYESCVLSVENEIEKGVANGTLVIDREITDTWITLSEEDERKIFAHFTSENRTFDCKQFSGLENGTALLEDQGHITVRRFNAGYRVTIENKSAPPRITVKP